MPSTHGPRPHARPHTPWDEFKNLSPPLYTDLCSLFRHISSTIASSFSPFHFRYYPISGLHSSLALLVFYIRTLPHRSLDRISQASRDTSPVDHNSLPNLYIDTGPIKIYILPTSIHPIDCSPTTSLRYHHRHNGLTLCRKPRRGSNQSSPSKRLTGRHSCRGKPQKVLLPIIEQLRSSSIRQQLYTKPNLTHHRKQAQARIHPGQQEGSSNIMMNEERRASISWATSPHPLPITVIRP